MTSEKENVNQEETAASQTEEITKEKTHEPTPEELKETIRDLKEVGIDIITIGQYLQASSKKLRVKEFVTPEQFKKYEEYGYSIGVKHMYSGPFVRSSYNASLFAEGISIES